MIAYFDESETEESKKHSYVVAGYVADCHRWKRFEREWKRILDEYGAPYLHMKEMANRRNRRSVYYGWSEQKCADFLGCLAFTITSKSGSIRPVSCAIPADEYLKLASKSEQKEIGHPYHLCLYWVLPGVLELFKDHSREIIDFVFDEKKGLQMKALEVFGVFKHSRRIHGVNMLAGLSFYDDKIVMPLQAADFLAYEINKVRREPNRRRKSLLALNPINGVHYNVTGKRLAEAMQAARKRAGRV